MLDLKHKKPTETKPLANLRFNWIIFLKLALQNAQRRPSRTLVLTAAVALATSAVFASYVVARGVADSTERSFARMGADLVVVPASTMVNITSALLTVQPTEDSLDKGTISQIAGMDGIERVAPQTIYQVGIMAGMPCHKANLIAFDPNSDFTVMPWLTQQAKRPMQLGDIISGGRRPEELGQEIQPFNQPATIYGKLGRSGVGPFDESLFASYETVAKLASGDTKGEYSKRPFSPSNVSALLIRLKLGTTPEQARFALSKIPNIKIVQGASIVTSSRQSSSILLYGMLVFAGVMLLGALLLIGLLYSAIVSERRKEIGVLSSLGARRMEIISMIVGEAGFTTGCGGVLGILVGGALLFVFQNSLVYYLETLRVQFSWPNAYEVGACAAICMAAAIAIGITAAAIPASSASREEPYSLMQREDSQC